MDEMYQAAQEALGEIARVSADVDMGMPPGAQPLPWKAQAVQFIDDLPDLMRQGPRYRQINATYGDGAADDYMMTMLRDIWKPRQRRRPME